MVDKQSNSPSPVRTLPPVQGQKKTGMTNAAKPATRTSVRISSLPFWAGLIISAAWIATVIIAVGASGPSHTFAGIPLASWAIGVSAAVSPVALIWMVTAYMQRAADIQSIAEPLRRQLLMITGESGAAEARIRRFNQAIKEQLDLLRNAQSMSQQDLAAVMDRVRQHKNELERFEHNSVHQVKEIQEIIRRNMQQVEHLMDDKFTMMRVLDDKLVQSGDSVARQAESVREEVKKLLEDIEQNGEQILDAINRAQQETRKMADTARAQETSLIGAATTAAETLGSVSGKIDMSVAHFLERAGMARAEAEHLAGALDAQTRSLDEFSNTLPARVSEAEAVLRNVADRLQASEQLAREQAVSLGEKLSSQVDGLQSFMDRFSQRLASIDTNLDQRRNDLDGLAGRIGDTTSLFVHQWEKSISDLNERTNSTLVRFDVINDQARKGAEAVSTQLNETTAKYEDAATRVRTLSAESNQQLKSMSGEVATYLAQFESLRAASDKAGEEVQNRAAVAMQNLQHVLERLLAAREATQAVGGTLVKDLYAAVDQNEQLIKRISDAARTSVQTIGVATETLGKQGIELAGQTQTAQSGIQDTIAKLQLQAQSAEKGLRDQAASLNILLNETQTQFATTEQKLQHFSANAVAPIQKTFQEIDVNTAFGLQSIKRYDEGLTAQLDRIQVFNARVGSMGEDLGRITLDGLSSVEQLNNRFLAVRAAQEETARQTLNQFSEMADRLHREITGLDTHSAEAVNVLQQSAARVGEQSYQLLQDAQNSGAQMKSIATALQTESSQIRVLLQKQSEDLNSDLNKAGQQFASLTDALKQRTDMAHVMLDKMATHYNEVTQDITSNMEVRAQRFEDAAISARDKAEVIQNILAQQLSLIGNGAAQLEAHSHQMSTSSTVALQQLSALNEKFSITHDAANNNMQSTMARLEDCNNSFMRQAHSLSEASGNSIQLIQKAGMTYSEQAEKMLATSHQMDQSLRQLTITTTTLADQSETIRANMEQHNMRLISQLTEAVTQMDTAGRKLETTVTAVSTGASEASNHFSRMTDSVSTSLKECQQDMYDVAGKTETALAGLGAMITQQTSSLSAVSEQLGEQARTLAATNENQRTQLIDLFDRLGSAHNQASEVADRTITRLNDALTQIQRNLGALGDQSQTAVGHVRTATSGFADQSVLLLQHAQQAEQQARTVLTVTSTLQEQARQLREALHGEGERTGDILTTLLTKITSGTGELRETGTSTEMALTNLQKDMALHSSSLNTTMQQITERQRSLTTALDAQRDVMNGLLNRLALAQDETASTAERTVARLTDGTQQMAKQLEVMHAQAQNTLASVHAAGAGFADEAGSLNVHAQQAEQQMRAVLSVTAGMQEQARNLREAMQGETARVIEQLNAVITQLDATNNQLKTQSSTVVHTMDQAALQFASLTASSGDAMQKQADTLSNAANQAEARMATAAEKIRGHLKLVTDIGDQTEQKANQIADTAEFAATRLVSLRDTLVATDRDGSASLIATTARIDEVKAALQSELQRLSDMSQTAVQQVNSASQSLATQSDVLRANLASSESALVEAADLVRQESVQTPAIIDRSSARIEAAASALKGQTAATEQALVQTADRFIQVTTTARESMVDEMRRVSHVADEADQVLRHFNRSIAEQVTALQQGTGQLSEGQRDLVEKANESITQLSAASARLAQLRIDATQTAGKLAHEFDTIDQRAAATTQRLTEISDNVVQNIETLAQTGHKAEAQMLNASSSFRDQLERIRTGLQGQIDDINRGLMQITTQLERTGSTLRSTTVGTVADVERISQRFDQTSKEAATQLVDKTALMRTATEEVARLLSGFGDQLDTLLDRLSVAGDGIRRHEGDLVGQMQTALSHLGTVAERLEAGRTLTTNVSEQAVARLTDVSDAIQEQLQTLTVNSQTAAGVMRGVSQVYGDQSQALNKNVSEAHSQVLTMNKVIDDMQQRTDRMRVSLKLQGEELMGSLQKILSQLHVTGDTLSDTVDQVLQQQAAENLKKIG